MVKPASPKTPQSTQQTVGTGDRASELLTPIIPSTPNMLPQSPPTAGYIQEHRSASLPNLSSGGRPGAGSVLSAQQQAQVYQSIQGDLDSASRSLSQYRTSQNPRFLAEARGYFEQAQSAYGENFPMSEGSFMLRDGNVSTIYDIGGLNTRLNAVGLSLRRAEQLQQASQ